MSFSEVQICNLALMKFGDLAISSLSDTSKEGRACNVFYPIMRDMLTYTYPWNFAMTRADISAQLADTPPFGFDYAYTLPTDCLRVWEFYGYTGEWVVESGQLLTDAEEEIYIRYIRKVTETAYFNPSYTDCLATRIGAELAGKLASNPQMMQTLLVEFNSKITTAQSLNAMEGNRPLHKDMQPVDMGNFSWQLEGR